jgi:hypothetical protein
MNGGISASPGSWRQTLAAALAILATLAMFLRDPLLRFDEVHYAPADLTQAFSLTRIDPGHPAGNQLMSDAVTQMEPWLMWNRDEFAAGRVPLWNPSNGAGAPHLANYQSAVFSPFSLPYYFLSFKAALIASAALKLFLIGFFAYLYLRSAGLGFAGALLGGLGFMYGGHQVLLLYFPHVGSMVSLPATLWCVELCVQRFRAARLAGARPRLAAPLLGVGLSLWTGLLAGNPEPFFFNVLFIAPYSTWRLASLVRECGWKPVSLLGGKLLAAAALAAVLAAFQLLPFFEYLLQSRVLEQRSDRQTPLDWSWWPLMLFPDALGNPASPYKISIDIPAPNYELVNMACMGGVCMLLAAVGGALAWKDRLARVHALAAVLWLFYAYDLFGAYDLFRLVPGLDMAPMNRSQGLWNFFVACLAGVAVDRLLAADGARRFGLAALVVFAGAAGLFACLLGVDRLVEAHAHIPSPNHHLFLAHVPAHLREASLLFVGAIACVATMLVARSRVARGFAAALLVVGAYLSTGDLWRGYNPVCDDRHFFPRTPAVEELTRHVGKERVAILGEDMIPPSSNLAYGIDSPQNYDGMWVRDYDFLYRDHFGDSNNWRPMLEGTKRSLQIFGVKWVLAKWDWIFLDNGLAGFGKAAGQKLIRHEILPGTMVEQTFRARSDGLQQVMFLLSAWPGAKGSRLRFRLQELETGRIVDDYETRIEDVVSTVHSEKHVVWPSDPKIEPHGRPFVFRFEPQASSDGKLYRAVLSSQDSRPGECLHAWSHPLWGYGEGESRHAGRRLAGEYAFDFSYDGADQYEKVADIAEYGLYRFVDALDKYTLVGGVVHADSRQEEIDLLRVPTFDPHKVVVLPRVEGRREAPGIDPSKRRLLQFPDKDWVYMLADDGKTLVHVDDEVTFLANKFRWDRIEHHPIEEKARYVVHDDADREGKRRHGLRLVTPPSKFAVPVAVVEEVPGRVVLDLARREPGWLLVAQTWYPGWRATLNGEDAEVLRANYAFQAVEIPPGQWRLELWYSPDSWRLGVALFWVGLALGAALLVREARGGWRRAA